MKKLFFILTLILFASTCFCYSEELANFLDIGQPEQRFAFAEEITEEYMDFIYNKGTLGEDYEAYKKAKEFYDLAEAEFDKGDCDKAFDNYHKSATILTRAVWAIDDTLKAGSVISINTKSDGIYKINPRELLYYSLYNMTCCKAQLHDYIQTRQYLYYAVLAGYPYINYILKDTDMKSYFDNSPDAKSELLHWVQQGNESSIVAGKTFSIGFFNGGCDVELYSDGTFMQEDRDMYYWGGFYGTYSVKDFVLILNYTKKFEYEHNGLDIGDLAYVEKHGSYRTIEEIYEKEPEVWDYRDKMKISLWSIEYPCLYIDGGYARRL
ncbi:MAG: hypothetical protein K6E51_11670 [Treponema sp.]|nr:hypothetical protein [Treponema sp.]